MGRRRGSGGSFQSRAIILAAALSPLVHHDLAGGITASWVSAVGGSWTDATKWSSNPFYPSNGTPASTTYDVSINATGFPYTVTLPSGALTINTLTFGSTDATLDVGGDLRVSGGQVLGNGQVVLDGGTLATVLNQSAAMNIGNGTTVRPGGNGGILSAGRNPLINQGTILCDMAAATTVLTGTLLTNSGTIQLSSGTLALQGDGSGGILNIPTGLGNFVRSGGLLTLQSVALNNTGATLDSAVHIYGSTITGGTIAASYSLPTPTEIAGTLLDGVTLSTNTQTQPGNGLSFQNGLNLNNASLTIYLGGGNTQAAIGTQTISGNGQIIATDSSGANSLAGFGGDGLTIGAGITIRTGFHDQTSNIHSLNVFAAVNQGTFLAQIDHMLLSASSNSASFTNNGTMSVSIGTLSLLKNWANNGTISATGGALLLNGQWTNFGSITAHGTYVQIGTPSGNLGSVSFGGCTVDITGTLTTAQLLQIQNLGSDSFGVGGGTLDNTNSSFVLSNATGDFRLNGGTIKGGTISAIDGRKLVPGFNTTIVGATLNLPLQGTNAGLELSNTIFNAPVNLTNSHLHLNGSWSNAGGVILGGGTLTLDSPLPSSLGSISISTATINLSGGIFSTSQLNSINSTSSTLLVNGAAIDNTGATLDVGHFGSLLQIQAGSRLTGGTLSVPSNATCTVNSSTSGVATFDAVTVSGRVTVMPIDLDILNGLTLQNGTIAVGANTNSITELVFNGPQSLSGTGTVRLDGDKLFAASLRTNGSLSIGAGIMIQSGTLGGTIGSATAQFSNAGTILALTVGKTLTLQAAAMTNSGILQATAGTLSLTTPANLTNLSGTTLAGGMYLVSGTATMSFGTATITTNNANIVLDGQTSLFAAVNPLAINLGTFTIRGGRSFASAGGFSNSGTLVIGAGSKFTGNGAFTNTGTVDIDGTLAVNYTTGSPLSSLVAQIGTNIVSPASLTNPRLAIGFSDDSNSHLVTLRSTWRGDANLDGIVDTSDFTRLANHFDSPTTLWSDGDFNYDGVVNALDFNALATNFGGTLSSPSLGVMVPEPQVFVAASCFCFISRRRNRR